MSHALKTGLRPCRSTFAAFLLLGFIAQGGYANATGVGCEALFGRSSNDNVTTSHVLGDPQGAQEFQESLRPQYTIDKKQGRMTFDWTKIKDNVGTALHLKSSQLKSVLLVDGETRPLANEKNITHAALKFDDIGRQHDVVIQLRDEKSDQIVHETYPIMMESHGSQMVDPSTFTDFVHKNALGLNLPESFVRASGVNDALVQRTVDIGYSKIVWTLTEKASPRMRALAEKYGLRLNVKSKLNDHGVPTQYAITVPGESVPVIVGADEIRIQNDAAFNGNAFLWDNEFVTLASAIHHPYLGQSTLDFHYATQLKNGAIPREVRHSNGISYHRYHDIKFGRTHENDEFTNPAFMGWVERYLYSLSDPSDGIRRFDRAIKSMTAYAKWLDENRSVHDKDGNFIGYWTSNLASGADNAPRGGGNHNKEHFHEYGWVDVLAQQMMLHKDISEMHAIRGEWDLADAAKAKAVQLQKLLNEKYWDEEHGFYFDLAPTKDGGFVRDVKTATQASFWPFLAGAASPAQVSRMIHMQMTPERFGGSFPAASLSSDHPEFHREGGYWRGGRWPPSAVVLAQAFENSGRPDQAYINARNFWSSMSQVSGQTVYEFYGMKKDANQKEKPIVGVQEGHTTRGDFTGWGKTPITYSGLRSVVGFKPVSAFMGSDLDRWIAHLKSSEDPSLRVFPDLTDSVEKRSQVARGYIQWNLFFSYEEGKSVHLENFFYRGRRVRSLDVQQISANAYRVTVVSDEPIQIQLNRYFDSLHPSQVSATPLAGSELVTVGGDQPTVEIRLNLRPQRR